MKRKTLKNKKQDNNWNNDSITKGIGKIKLSVNDASEQHDKYIYGPKKKANKFTKEEYRKLDILSKKEKGKEKRVTQKYIRNLKKT